VVPYSVSEKVGGESLRGQIQGGPVVTDVSGVTMSSSACDVTSFCFKKFAAVHFDGRVV
jgi:hypothetical protein